MTAALKKADLPARRARKQPFPLALILRTLAAWASALLLFFPLGWLVLTAFKTELQAISQPPLLIFTPTLDNFAEVQVRSDYLLYAGNSLITSLASTLLGLALAAPAAYSMAFFRSRHTKDILMWMLSTKMMPAVGALVPIYVIAQTAGLLDTRLALILRTLAAWASALLLFFPLGWLVLSAFKTELQAISQPPLLIFAPTLDNFAEVQVRSDYLLYAGNSLITSLASTLLGLALAAPAAYSMAFFRSKHTKDILMWMLSTKMMPAVGALVPIYVIAQTAGLLDTRLALIVVFTLSNLPIMVWMLYSNYKDIPSDILEAARMDGATLWQEFRQVLLPLSWGGLASTGLLCLVLSWNEAFWSLNLSSAKAGTLATLIASYASPEGLFWAKLSAASLMAIAPIVVFGWFSQKQLVQGLTFGAVK